MASAASFEDVCAVCLDTRPLKIVGRCKHRFCKECLTITLGSQDGDVFACPTCKVDCPRPWDGIKGMVDFTGEDVAVTESGVKTLQRGGKEALLPRGRRKAGEGAECLPNEGSGEGNRKKRKRDGNVAGIALAVKCMICHHKKKEVQAVNSCVECDNLHICNECTKVHARNKATRRHVVIHLKAETRCEEHNSPLNSYCRDCGEAVCMVCVMLAHGQHKVEKLADVVHEKVAELKVTLKKKGKKLERVKDLRCNLATLQLIAPVVDKQDILIKEIEDHAQKCFEQITKWKEGLKDQVKEEYKVIKEIPVGFQKVSKMVKELQDPTERAGRLLTKTEYDPEYLDKLIAMQKEMDALVDVEGDIEEEGYRERLRVLHRKRHTFFFREIPVSFGRLDCAEDEESNYGYFDNVGGRYRHQEIFHRTMHATSVDMFIPCVANLGMLFAVAHPARLGEPSTAIDIYELPGKLKNTLTDHVPPLYDMSSTPDGKLAVLSNGTAGGTGCSVKLFNPDTGYVNSTRDMDIAEPLSLGVTLQHQYVILGGNKEGERVITVADKSGAVQHTLTIDKDFIWENSVKEESDSDAESNEHGHKDTKGYSNSDAEVMKSSDECDSDVASNAYSDSSTDTDADSTVAVDVPKRIACGGRFIFVLGDKTVAVYEITDTGIHAYKIIELNYRYKYTDITATVWDDFFITDVDSGCVWMKKWVMDQVSKCEWNYGHWRNMFDAEFGVIRPSMVSICDRDIVICQGQTIRVFKDQK